MRPKRFQSQRGQRKKNIFKSVGEKPNLDLIEISNLKYEVSIYTYDHWHERTVLGLVVDSEIGLSTGNGNTMDDYQQGVVKSECFS